MASVDISQVRKDYGKQTALHGVSAHIADGEFVVLVGPSGCGKSTLLRMIAGLEEISGGEIAIAGRRVNETPAKARDIAMVFQNYALYPHMNVADNMGFALTLARVPTAERDRRVREAAEILDLVPYLERKPKALSGGQRQRVAMGRAIVRNPSVFLFDEPLSNLDAKLRVQMRSEIKSLHRRLGTTMIYVTHDQVEAMTMADRIIVMRAGNVEQIGTPLDLYDSPANTFVAQFIGSPSMNLLKGRAVEGRFKLDSGQDLGISVPTAFSADTQLLLGKRPEDIVFDESGIPVTIEAMAQMGSETQVSVQLGTQTLEMFTRERTAMQIGDTRRVSLAANATHFFDAKAGERIQLP
ncbi:ABC transporter ATP-binding protein [Pelagibacterium sp.]|uniref:ABC transporter ATP-binding protein n=1 Tax=Pelagibacterium sp. TaxID=1967288 RepID=UPI003A905DB3